MLKPDKTTVFYDGGCPLCRREIDHYRRIDLTGRMCWLDVTREHGALDEFGLSVHAAMAQLHVMDRDGVWHTGAYGFAAMWEELPRYRWLARMLRRTRMLPVLDIIYKPFARWRLKRRCTQSPCPSSI
jgi:predicted DCC family thiol-disulfide oxidoreductase YuxK